MLTFNFLLVYLRLISAVKLLFNFSLEANEKEHARLKVLAISAFSFGINVSLCLCCDLFNRSVCDLDSIQVKIKLIYGLNI